MDMSLYSIVHNRMIRRKASQNTPETGSQTDVNPVDDPLLLPGLRALLQCTVLHNYEQGSMLGRSLVYIVWESLGRVSFFLPHQSLEIVWLVALHATVLFRAISHGFRWLIVMSFDPSRGNGPGEALLGTPSRGFPRFKTEQYRRETGLHDWTGAAESWGSWIQVVCAIST